MRRFRATTATNDIDRAVQAQATVAERALRQALDVCHKQSRTGDYDAARLSRVRRDVLAALGAVERIRMVANRYESEDPDLQPTRPYERPAPRIVEPTPEPTIDNEVNDGE